MSEVYKINCIIPNGRPEFPVKIGKNESVGELKDAIKQKMAPNLNAFDAPTLNLYRIDVDASDEKKAIEEVKTLALANRLNTSWKLSRVFPSVPPDGEIHILVKLPEGGSIVLCG